MDGVERSRAERSQSYCSLHTWCYRPLLWLLAHNVIFTFISTPFYENISLVASFFFFFEKSFWMKHCDKIHAWFNFWFCWIEILYSLLTSTHLLVCCQIELVSKGCGEPALTSSRPAALFMPQTICFAPHPGQFSQLIFFSRGTPWDMVWVKRPPEAYLQPAWAKFTCNCIIVDFISTCS